MKVIKIGAVWCVSCIIMNNVMEEVREGRDFELVEYDLDDDEAEVAKFEVGKKIPMLIICKDDGVELERVVGEKSKKELGQILDKYLEG